MYEVCENCEEVFDPSGACTCGAMAPAPAGELTVGIDAPIQVSGHGEADEPHKACGDDGSCDPDVNKANRADVSCGTARPTTAQDVLAKLDAALALPSNESFSFDKHMDALLISESAQRAKKRVTDDSPQRLRQARRQERPLGRTVFGRKP